MNISQFINKYYDVEYINPYHSDLEKTEVFLMGQVLSGEYLYGEAAINALFINTFSKQKDAVLVESVPAMKSIHPNESPLSVWLNDPVTIIGYDIGYAEQITGEKFCQDMQDWGLKYVILSRKYLENNEKEQKKELKEKMIVIMSKIKSIVQDHEQFFFTDIIAKNFAARLKSIQTTIMEAKPEHDRLFVVGNSLFFQQQPGSDARYSIAKLNDFLETQNAVKLFPKHKMAIKLGEIHRELHQKIQRKIS